MDPIPSPPPILVPPPDVPEPLLHDTPCRKCSYNLRGLSPDGRCPECGSPVGLSIHGDLLRYSNPQWLLLLARGISFMLWGILVAFIVGIISGLFDEYTHPLVTATINFLGSLVAVYGAWLFTEPDPSGLGEANYGNARKLIRIALVVGLIGQPLQALVDLSGITQIGRVVLLVLALLMGLIGLAGEFAKYVYLQRLVLRIPDHSLASRAVTIRWGYTITLGVIAVFGGIILILTTAGGTTPTSGVLMPIGCFIGIAGITWFVFAIMALFLLYHTGKALRHQATLAHSAWSSPGTT